MALPRGLVQSLGAGSEELQRVTADWRLGKHSTIFTFRKGAECVVKSHCFYVESGQDGFFVRH